jgi:hypothetical protein
MTATVLGFQGHEVEIQHTTLTKDGYVSMQSIAIPQTQEFLVECQGKNRMFFRKNRELRLC